MYYTVCQDWDYRWSVRTFGGRTAAEERRYANNGMKIVHRVFRTLDKALAELKKVKAKEVLS